MKVAITGANGFLGRYLMDAFIEDGHETIALVRNASALAHLTENHLLRVHQMNYVSITEEIEELKKGFGGIDLFIHNAGVTTSLHPQEYFDINVSLTEQLLRSLKSTSLLSENGKFIHISSYAAHGPSNQEKPVSSYGKSKKQAEALVEQSGLPFLIVRPTAIYGAGDLAFLALFKSAKKGVYPLIKPAQKMSMIHARDLSSIIIKQAETLQGFLHVSDGNTYSHDDFRKAFSEALEVSVRFLRIPPFLAKLSLWFSDRWHSLIGKRPTVTLEKFNEISQDWDLHSDSKLHHAQVSNALTLKQGFENAYAFYQENHLI